MKNLTPLAISFINKNKDVIEACDSDYAFEKMFKKAYDFGGRELARELREIFCEAEIYPSSINLSTKGLKSYMNYFKFHPVGQGLFYTGQLANSCYNFVYDCGSEEQKTYIENSIESFKNSIQEYCNDMSKIDCVFISHLHYDHFSGLQRLIRSFKIEKLFLPYIGWDKDFIQLILAYEIFCEKEDLELQSSDDARGLFRILSTIYIEKGWDTISEIIFTESDNSTTENGNTYSYNSFSVNLEKNDYWNFVWFNKRIDDEKLKSFADKVKAKLNELKIESIEDLINQNAFDVIKQIYIGVFGNNLNVTSTVLLHYPSFNPLSLRTNAYNTNAKTIDYINLLRKRNSKNNFFTMLTGDAEIDDYIKNQISKHFDFDKESISILQVPHHGAKDNWNKLKKLEANVDVYVISYGLGNTYHHPNKTVVNSIMEKEKPLFSVNQTSCMDYYIY